MSRRPSTGGSSGFEDIFGDGRTLDALATATAPVEEPAAAPPPPVTPERSQVVAIPAAPERAREPATTGRKGSQTPEVAQEGAKSLAPAPSQSPAEEKASATVEAEALAPVHEAHVTLKLRVPQSIRADFKRFSAELGAVLGVPVDDSNIGRPLLEQFLNEQCERILEAASSHGMTLKRPANGDAVGMAEFDETLGKIFQEARKRRRSKTPADH